jgi:predicted house-cleaning noncanonical NTP pyrophosphatase (MazG superfamily)
VPSYKKLVRDNIPEIIMASGEKPITRILDKKEYLAELVKKIKEEVAEFEEDHSVEELADIQEVLIAIRDALGIKTDELEIMRLEKANKNGQFKKRIYLERVE